MGAAAALATVFVSACGSSGGGGGSSGTGSASPTAIGSDLAAKVKGYEQPLTSWPGPTQAVKAVTGKKVGLVSCGVTSPACPRMLNGMQEAAKALGWTVVETYNPPALTPSSENAALQHMIAAGVDGIVCVCIPRPLLQDTLAMARAKNVSFITVRSEDDTFTDPSDTKVGAGEGLAGDIIGDYVVNASGGKANVIMIRDDDFGILKDISDHFKKKIQACSGCKLLAEQNIPTADVFQKAVGEVASLLQRFPQTDYLYSTFDAEGRLAISAIKQVQLIGKVKVVGGTGGEEQTLQLIQSDRPATFVATTSPPDEWAGWAGIDNLLRVFQGQQPVTNTNRPLLTAADNISTLCKSSCIAYTGVEAGLDFHAEYKKLWGLG